MIGERVRRRVAREPVAYILGRKGFRHIELAVDPRVLIPRPETELLVEVALELPDGARVHDVGTGVGRGGARAARRAARPAGERLRRLGCGGGGGAGERRRLGLDAGASRWRAGCPHGEYDLVVANLPYVAEDEVAGAGARDPRYEPREALVAGADGLDAIRALVARRRPARGWRWSTRPTGAGGARRCWTAPRPTATSPATSA